MANAKKTNSRPAIKLDDSTYVKVRSNQYGRMRFKNKRTGDSVYWTSINDVQDMTVGDLRAMKSSDPVFLSDTWIVIEAIEDEACADLTREQLYEVLGLSQFFSTGRPRYLQDILTWKQNEIAERVPKMSVSTQANIITALNTEIASGGMDSVSLIRAWEKALGVELDKELDKGVD